VNSLGLGKRIGSVRRENGLTAEHLSEICGVQPITIRQIEGGSRLPSLSLLIRICNALHASPNYLLADSLEKTARDTLDALIKQFEGLTPEQMETIQSIIAIVVEYMSP